MAPRTTLSTSIKRDNDRSDHHHPSPFDSMQHHHHGDRPQYINIKKKQAHYSRHKEQPAPHNNIHHTPISVVEPQQYKLNRYDLVNCPYCGATIRAGHCRYCSARKEVNLLKQKQTSLQEKYTARERQLELLKEPETGVATRYNSPLSNHRRHAASPSSLFRQHKREEKSQEVAAFTFPHCPQVVVVHKSATKQKQQNPKKSANEANSPLMVITLVDSNNLTFRGTVSNDSTTEKGYGVFSHFVSSFHNRAVVYEGSYENGKFHGQGLYRDVDGYTYEGTFQKSLRHGHGKASWPCAGKVYEGQWFEDEMQGTGQETLSKDGVIVYQGEFFSGLRNGNGVETQEGGETFEGKWRNGKRHGPGKVMQSGRIIRQGQWANGNFVS